MLVLCFGSATKLTQYILEDDKSYSAILKLGEETSTGDKEGNIISTLPIPKKLNLKKILYLEKKFTGIQYQKPPMYSALKYHGIPLYKYARKGITIFKPKRKIIIKSLKIYSYSCYPNKIIFHTICSKGTYIRILAEDLAKELGTVGHLIALHRNYYSRFKSYKMHTLENLNNKNFLDKLIPMDSGILKWVIYNANINEWKMLYYGINFTLSKNINGWIRIYFKKKLVAISYMQNGNFIKKKILCSSHFIRI